ncbi:MAG TPA: GGDEF domain-containing protein [Paracoccaceae bacterium]|nr:GGDEF domain-containing protein [Paracoccaceae bacterium]
MAGVGPEGPVDGALLPHALLDRLVPLHVCIGPDGRIRSMGPTLRHIMRRPEDDRTAGGAEFFALFRVHRPSGIAGPADLARRAGERLQVMLVDRAEPVLRGTAFVLPRGGGLLVSLSFGFGVIQAVRDYALTDRDFALTDLAMELLYLHEAKSAVAEELRNLNRRLQGAKRAAEQQALTDMLTGLQNRRALDLALSDNLGRGLPFGVMHIDLDYFKAVNDSLGHAAGDHVLREVAGMLMDETRKDDLVARIGGDEFVLGFPGMTGTDELTTVADRIVQRLSEPIDFEGQACLISASIGIVISTAFDAPTAERLLAAADTALYASKHAGRGRALFHDGAMPPSPPAVHAPPAGH